VRKFIGFLILFVLFAFSVARAEEPDCMMCHPDKASGKSIHTAVTMGCMTCHSGLDASGVPHRTGKTRGGLSAEGADLCYSCHDKTAFSTKNAVHAPVEGGMCLSCHDPHSSKFGRLLLSEQICFECHDKAGIASKEHVHTPVAGGMCVNCHNQHQSDNDKLLLMPQPDLCFNCHDKMAFYAPIIHLPVSMGMCSSCHSPHQSGNEKLLISSSKDLCFNCHDEINFYRNGSVHEPVKEGQCLICHRPHAGPNDSLVYRRGNILCRRCHSKVEKSPHLVSVFSKTGHPLRGRKDPNRPGKTFGCLSCHLPHSSESASLFRFKANSTFSLCTYCHDM
jgi:predicted CXXCH cytochrome family protein